LLKHPTLDQLHSLGLHGMAKAFVEIAAGGEASGLGHHEWLGLLLDRETSWRQDKRLAARLRVAKLRQQACVEDVDYRSPRGLDRALFNKLVESEWIAAHDNLALTGPTDPDSYCSSLDLLKVPVLFVADRQTADGGGGALRRRL
jgi:IstB-like ATP binding protein